MTYDDLNLVRAFSTDELFASFHGNWDPDRFNTPGLRPGTMLFNHVRYLAFGENVVAHRLFTLALFALVLALVARLAARLGLPPAGGLLAGALCLASRYSVYHYVWITEANHMVQGLAFAAAALLAVHGLERGSVLRLSLSAAAFLIGLATREDMIVTLPALLLLAWLEARRRPAESRRPLATYTAALVSLCLAFFVYRAAVVSGAPVPRKSPLMILWGIRKAFGLVGDEPFDGAWIRGLVAVWPAAPLLLLAVLALHRRRVAWQGPLLWLGCALPACAPSLTYVRGDLLFFAVIFAAFFYAAAVAEAWRVGGGARMAAVALIGAGLLGGAFVSRVFATHFHPASATAVRWNAQYLKAASTGSVTIPEQRRQKIARQLHALGIRPVADYERLLPPLEAAALADDRRDPGPDDVLFVPRIRGVW